ncbi:MAG: hypothetical protein U0359_14825 [Byssovorax sp.]
MPSISRCLRLLAACIAATTLGCGDVSVLSAGSESSSTGSTGGGAGGTTGGGDGGSSWTTSSTSGDGGGGGSGGSSVCPGGAWSKRFGGAEDQRMEALAVDSHCNLYVAATSTGPLDLGNGPLQGKLYAGTVLAKLGPDGQAIWSRWMESSNLPLGIAALAIDPEDNLVFAGVFSGTFDFGSGPVQAGDKGSAYVAKIGPHGGLLWERHFEATLGLNMNGTTVAAREDGGVVLTVAYDGTADFGDGPKASLGEDIAVIALGVAGQTLWVRRFGGPGNTLDQVTSLALGPNGEIAIAGDYEGQLDLGTGPLPFAFSGGFVGLLDPDGQAIFARAMPEAACDFNECSIQVAFNTAGAPVVVGEKHFDPMNPDPAEGLFMEVLGTTGAIVESHDLGGRRVRQIAAGQAGRIGLAGEIEGAAAAAVDPDGTKAWSEGKLAMESLGDYDAGGRAIAVDPGGGWVVAGAFRGTVDFGEGAMVSAGKRDLFLARVPGP